ncbi:MAG: hypothetical protein CL678_16685 [Bdellovibrionaceae bacterium]|nr:hypothetical protein [Pseudobdellovibrionaceae bacterium]
MRKSHGIRPGYPLASVHPMIVAAGSRNAGTFEVLRWYIEERRESPLRLSCQNISALHCAIAAGCADKIRYLIPLYTDPRQFDQHRGGTVALPVATLIAWAAYSGQIEAVRMMVARGANINRYSPAPEDLWPNACRFVSPLVAAIVGIAERKESGGVIIATLLQLGANPNQPGNGIRKSTDSQKALPIQVAIRLGLADVVLSLVRGGADPNKLNGGFAYNQYNMTWYAVTHANVTEMPLEIIDIMVAFGGAWNRHQQDVVGFKHALRNSRAYNKVLQIEMLRCSLRRVDSFCNALGYPEAASLRLARNTSSLAYLVNWWSPEFLMKHAVWRFEVHHLMPPQYRRVVRLLWLIRTKIKLESLPTEIWGHILSFLDRAAFAHTLGA